MSGQVIRDRLEIVSTLRQLARAEESLSVEWDEGDGSLARHTRLLAVNPDYEELVFDCFADTDANDRLLKASQVNFHCHLDGVELRFFASHGQEAVHGGHQALRMRLPSQMLRIQRREYFRVPATQTSEIALETDGHERLPGVRVGDLSIGGLKLVADQPFDAKLGQVIERCRLRLGDEGQLQAALEVRSVEPVPSSIGAARVRIGCRFVSLSPENEMLLARLIQKLERRALR